MCWAKEGITLSKNLIKIKKNGTAIPNPSFSAKVEDTTLDSGSTTIVLDPGAYRINITGDDGSLDDWVDFTVIKLIENDPDFNLTVNEFTYLNPLNIDDEDEMNSYRSEITGELKYGQNSKIDITRGQILNKNIYNDGNLKIWAEDLFEMDDPNAKEIYREATIENVYNVYDWRDFNYSLTQFGRMEKAGGENVYLPYSVSVKQLLDDEKNPVVAGNGGHIYYMCGNPPDLHVEKEERQEMGKLLRNGSFITAIRSFRRDIITAMKRIFISETGKANSKPMAIRL